MYETAAEPQASCEEPPVRGERSRPVAALPESFRQRRQVAVQISVRPVCPGFMGQTPSQKRRMRGQGPRSRRYRVLEKHSLSSEPTHIRTGGALVAVGGEMIGPERIHYDDQHV